MKTFNVTVNVSISYDDNVCESHIVADVRHAIMCGLNDYSNCVDYEPIFNEDIKTEEENG